MLSQNYLGYGENGALDADGQVTSERGETSWQRSGLLRRDEWEETFELCRWCAPEEVKGIKVTSSEGRKQSES